MGTVNGKLITQELNQFDELTHRTERINQRFEYLESQVTAMSKQNYAQDFQNLSQEVNSNKSYLHKLDQRIGFLEDMISRQAQQLFLLKIGSAIILIGLGLMFCNGVWGVGNSNRQWAQCPFVGAGSPRPCRNSDVPIKN